MNELEAIAKDGFSLDARDEGSIDLSLISLRVALKAYFSTYQAQKYYISNFDGKYSTNRNISKQHTLRYCEQAAETIIHFQHFAELVCKRFLKEDHPLLSDVALQNAEVLHKLIHGEALQDGDQTSVRSIEFSEALERLNKLIKTERIKGYEKLKFITDSIQTLKTLNTLRNRVWHKGLYIVSYKSLDKFIGKFILPFVSKIFEHPLYLNQVSYWKYDPLQCEIDPFNEIIAHCKNEDYNIKKVAWLKELGRAAYENPIKKPSGKSDKTNNFLAQFLRKEHDEHVKLVQKTAEFEVAGKYSHVEDCPVCGIKSLVIHGEIDHDEFIDDYGNKISESYSYTDIVKCMCCTFRLEHGIDDASIYGIKGISNFFKN